MVVLKVDRWDVLKADQTVYKMVVLKAAQMVCKSVYKSGHC